MSGIASRGALRMVYRLRKTPAATRTKTINLKRITPLMMLLIIIRYGLADGFQLVFRVDEETSETDDLVSGLQAFFHGRIKLALDAYLDFYRSVLIAFAGDIHNVLCAFLDNRFVRNGEELPAFGHDFHPIVETARIARSRKSDFHRNATVVRRHFRDVCLEHGRFRFRRKCPYTLPDLYIGRFGRMNHRSDDLSRFVDSTRCSYPGLNWSHGNGIQRQCYIAGLLVAAGSSRSFRVISKPVAQAGRIAGVLPGVLADALRVKRGRREQENQEVERLQHAFSGSSYPYCP